MFLTIKPSGPGDITGELRRASALGLPAPNPEYFRTARADVLDRVGLRGLRAIYDDAFYRTVDDEYSGFASAPFPEANVRAIKDRVLAAIRTIAAFSSWYAVAWYLQGRAIVAAGL